MLKRTPRFEDQVALVEEQSAAMLRQAKKSETVGSLYPSLRQHSDFALGVEPHESLVPRSVVLFVVVVVCSLVLDFVAGRVEFEAVWKVSFADKTAAFPDAVGDHFFAVLH